jgi:ParB-like chromosome segregation protein Spo0J
MSTHKAIKELTVKSPFKDLFAIEPDVLAATLASIKEEGFDPERPIFAWKNGSELVVVDGHTRLEAARKARLKQVPVVVRKFTGEDEAFWFACVAQRDRRNLTKEQIATAIARAELAKAESMGSPTMASPLGSPKGVKGGARGGTKDPVKQAVVESAAKLGVQKRTAERGLANARAKRKPTASPAPSPPTLPELKELHKDALAAARAVGPALTAATKSDDVDDLKVVGRAAFNASSSYGAFLRKLDKYIDHKEKQ